jgi:hypothetical protein
VRLALAQLDPTVGDLAGNAALIRAAVDRAAEQGAELVLLKTLLQEERQTRRLITGALLFAGGFIAGAALISLSIFYVRPHCFPLAVKMPARLINYEKILYCRHSGLGSGGDHGLGDLMGPGSTR